MTVQPAEKEQTYLLASEGLEYLGRAALIGVAGATAITGNWAAEVHNNPVIKLAAVALVAYEGVRLGIRHATRFERRHNHDLSSEVSEP